VQYVPIWVAGDAQLDWKDGLDAEVLYLESALVRTIGYAYCGSVDF
jgi:hypothetical protein